ncbi:MAG: NAD(P)-binding domain-containing protein, partial [Rhodospirillales bacterium]|nr:NAD(P)-binding domain-containing protein [Rhodospirillales bacterium]
MSGPLFEKIAFIGIGLIGSSLARAVRREGLAGHIIACDQSEQHRAETLDLGVADTVT